MNCKLCNIILDNNTWLPSRRKRNQKICKFCIRNDNNERYGKNKLKYLSSNKVVRKSIKYDVFLYYGGKCQLCGEDNLDKLSLDHIDGNGRKHRKSILKIDSGSAFYKYVNKNKPTNLRLLCFNCNCQHNMTETQTDKYNKSNTQIKLKKIAYNKYGGACEGCGCNKYEFLTIDHINNNGADHRKEIGTNIYSWLKTNNYPKEGFQILCFNCNYIKHFNLK